MKSQTATVEVRMEESDETGSPRGFTFRGKYLEAQMWSSKKKPEIDGWKLLTEARIKCEENPSFAHNEV